MRYLLRYPAGNRRHCCLHLPGGGHLARLPPTAKGFDQLNACHHALHPEVHGGLLIAQKNVLSGNHVQIWIKPALVSDSGFLKAAGCSLYGPILLNDVLRQNSDRCEIVFHLLKRGKRDLLIILHGLVILRAILLNGCLAEPGVKDGFRDARAEGPGSGSAK